MESSVMQSSRISFNKFKHFIRVIFLEFHRISSRANAAMLRVSALSGHEVATFSAEDLPGSVKEVKQPLSSLTNHSRFQQQLVMKGLEGGRPILWKILICCTKRSELNLAVWNRRSSDHDLHISKLGAQFLFQDGAADTGRCRTGNDDILMLMIRSAYVVPIVASDLFRAKRFLCPPILILVTLWKWCVSLFLLIGIISGISGNSQKSRPDQNP